MLSNLRLYQISEVPFEPLVRALLIRAHQTGVAGHVGGEDCGETARLAHGGNPRRPEALPNASSISRLAKGAKVIDGPVASVQAIEC